MGKVKLSVTEDGDLLLEDVYSGVLFKTREGIKFGICMRDGGYEFVFNNKWYSANNGEIKQLDSTSESLSNSETSCDNQL